MKLVLDPLIRERHDGSLQIAEVSLCSVPDGDPRPAAVFSETPRPSMTVKQAAEALGKDVTTIHRYIRKHLLRAEREETVFGAAYFLYPEEVARFTPPALGNPNIAQVRADTLARKAAR